MKFSYGNAHHKETKTTKDMGDGKNGFCHGVKPAWFCIGRDFIPEKRGDEGRPADTAVYRYHCIFLFQHQRPGFQVTCCRDRCTAMERGERRCKNCYAGIFFLPAVKPDAAHRSDSAGSENTGKRDARQEGTACHSRHDGADIFGGSSRSRFPCCNRRTFFGRAWV